MKPGAIILLEKASVLKFPAGPAIGLMKRRKFYAKRSVVRCEWWLDESRLPSLHWARLRILDNGCADVTWEEGETTYGFEAKIYAVYFLAEDEY